MESNLRNCHPDDAYEQYLQAREAAAVLAAQSRPLRPSRRPQEEEVKNIALIFLKMNYI